jgi:hypothetical protein
MVLDDGVGPLAALALPAPPEGFQRLRRVARLDADDHDDLDLAPTIASGIFGPPGLHGVLLYANDGAGTFAYAGRIATADPPFGLCAGDFDADGHDDLAAADFGSANLGVHDTFDPDLEAFVAAESLAAGLGPVALAAGELNPAGLVPKIEAVGLPTYNPRLPGDERESALRGQRLSERAFVHGRSTR